MIRLALVLMFVIPSSGAAFAAIPFVASPLAGGKPNKPNILFIMSDDHCARAIGAYRGRLAGLNPTPALDRLAAEGMRFDRVFCTNQSALPVGPQS